MTDTNTTQLTNSKQNASDSKHATKTRTQTQNNGAKTPQQSKQKPDTMQTTYIQTLKMSAILMTAFCWIGLIVVFLSVYFEWPFEVNHRAHTQSVVFSMKKESQMSVTEITVLLKCNVIKESSDQEIHFDGYHHKETIEPNEEPDDQLAANSDQTNSNDTNSRTIDPSVTFRIPFHSHHNWKCRAYKTAPYSCRGSMYVPNTCSNNKNSNDNSNIMSFALYVYL